MRISDRHLKARLLKEPDISSVYTIGLKITPTPKPEDISGVTVDVHLDNEFQIYSGKADTVIDLGGTKDELLASAKECFETRTGPVVLRPGEFCLGCTAETITIPKTLVGWLDGRSTLARFGLLVHVTAHRVDPGWNGKVVLEFYNAGPRPLRLQPGMKIGAMSFEEISCEVQTGYGDRADASYKNQQSVVLPGGTFSN